MKTFKQILETLNDDGTTHVNIDGIKRSRYNSEGKLIHHTEDGIKNFWKWFGNSKTVDEHGRPLVMYRGMAQEHDPKHESRITWVTPHAEYANHYASHDGNMMKLYAKTDNPINLGFRSQLTHVKFKDVASHVKSRLMDDYDNGTIDERSARGVIKHLDKGVEEHGEHMAPVWIFHNDSHHLHNALKHGGYDSISSHEGDNFHSSSEPKFATYGILNKNGIKSVISNNGNYSRNGNSDITEDVSMNEGHIDTYKGVKLFPTNHSEQRELERNIPREHIKSIFKTVVDKIKSGEYSPPSDGSSFMVHSKKHNQTIILSHRPDKYAKNDKRSHVFIVTGYDPKTETKPRIGQQRLYTECLEI